MEILPAIDLRGGQVVRLFQGDYDQMTVYGQDPCAQSRAFAQAGARNLHLVDLDGAKDGTLANFETIRAILAQGGLFVEVGGGIRTEERICRYLELGVGRVILGTIAVQDFDFTSRMARKIRRQDRRGGGRPGRLGGHQRLEGEQPGKGPRTFAAACGTGASGPSSTPISAGTAPMQGTNLELYRQLAQIEGLRIIASGGISFESELTELDKMGVYGAILGKALYTGKLDLAKVIQAVQSK